MSDATATMPTDASNDQSDEFDFDDTLTAAPASTPPSTKTKATATNGKATKKATPAPKTKAKPVKAASKAKAPKTTGKATQAKGKAKTAATATVAPSKSVATAKAAKPSKSEAARFYDLANMIKHASDPTRLQVLLMLADGESNVGNMCASLNNSQPATSHHLALLRHGGIIAPRRAGKNNFYALTDRGRILAQSVAKLIEKTRSMTDD